MMKNRKWILKLVAAMLFSVSVGGASVAATEQIHQGDDNADNLIKSSEQFEKLFEIKKKLIENLCNELLKADSENKILFDREQIDKKVGKNNNMVRNFIPKKIKEILGENLTSVDVIKSLRDNFFVFKNSIKAYMIGFKKLLDIYEQSSKIYQQNNNCKEHYYDSNSIQEIYDSVKGEVKNLKDSINGRFCNFASIFQKQLGLFLKDFVTVDGNFKLFVHRYLHEVFSRAAKKEENVDIFNVKYMQEFDKIFEILEDYCSILGTKDVGSIETFLTKRNGDVSYELLSKKNKLYEQLRQNVIAAGCCPIIYSNSIGSSLFKNNGANIKHSRFKECEFNDQLKSNSDLNNVSCITDIKTKLSEFSSLFEKCHDYYRTVNANINDNVVYRELVDSLLNCHVALSSKFKKYLDLDLCEASSIISNYLVKNDDKYEDIFYKQIKCRLDNISNILDNYSKVLATQDIKEIDKYLGKDSTGELNDVLAKRRAECRQIYKFLMNKGKLLFTNSKLSLKDSEIDRMLGYDLVDFKFVDDIFNSLNEFKLSFEELYKCSKNGSPGYEKLKDNFEKAYSALEFRLKSTLDINLCDRTLFLNACSSGEDEKKNYVNVISGKNNNEALGCTYQDIIFALNNLLLIFESFSRNVTTGVKENFDKGTKEVLNDDLTRTRTDIVKCLCADLNKYEPFISSADQNNVGKINNLMSSDLNDFYYIYVIKRSLREFIMSFEKLRYLYNENDNSEVGKRRLNSEKESFFYAYNYLEINLSHILGFNLHDVKLYLQVCSDGEFKKDGKSLTYDAVKEGLNNMLDVVVKYYSKFNETKNVKKDKKVKNKKISKASAGRGRKSKNKFHNIKSTKIGNEDNLAILLTEEDGGKDLYIDLISDDKSVSEKETKQIVNKNIGKNKSNSFQNKLINKTDNEDNLAGLSMKEEAEKSKQQGSLSDENKKDKDIKNVSEKETKQIVNKNIGENKDNSFQNKLINKTGNEDNLAGLSMKEEVEKSKQQGSLSDENKKDKDIKNVSEKETKQIINKNIGENKSNSFQNKLINKTGNEDNLAILLTGEDGGKGLYIDLISDDKNVSEKETKQITNKKRKRNNESDVQNSN